MRSVGRSVLVRIEARVQGVSVSDRMDFLAKCVELSKAGKLDQDTINNVVGTNIGAGSDTTGISISAVTYLFPDEESGMHAETPGRD